ncbi:MAG: histidine kinase [Bacteroidota bacterium]
MNSPPLKISRAEALWVLFFYAFMAINYYIVLIIDTGTIVNFGTVLLNHALKGLLTLPLWWLLFRRLSEYPIWKRAWVHLLTLPLFCILWTQVYYVLCEYLGLFYLKGSDRVWDFYLAALFYLIQFVGFHMYEYFVRHRKQALLTAQLKQLATQSELSALKAQLNPHFLYNVFNTINAAIPSKAERSRNMVAKLSDLFRYQLKASKEEAVTVREELDFVLKYLDLEKERFGDRLRFESEIEEGALPRLVPPLLLQPLVENAVKHGLSPLIEGGELTIRVSVDESRLCFAVADTGVGLAPDSEDTLLSQGVGLSNTHNRLVKMFGEGLSFTPQSPRGLMVQFSIPTAWAP